MLCMSVIKSNYQNLQMPVKKKWRDGMMPGMKHDREWSEPVDNTTFVSTWISSCCQGCRNTRDYFQGQYCVSKISTVYLKSSAVHLRCNAVYPRSVLCFQDQCNFQDQSCENKTVLFPRAMLCIQNQCCVSKSNAVFVRTKLW